MKLNKKGMTLFELLAVIVILGIVAAIAFPTVNGIISNTKKDAFAQNVNNFINAAIQDANYEAIQDNSATVITYTIANNSVSKQVGETTIPNPFDLTGGLKAGVLVVNLKDGNITSIQVTTQIDDGQFITNSMATADTSSYRFARGTVAPKQ